MHSNIFIEMCSTPTVLSGGYYNLSTDGSVTIATYTCYDGYSLSGAKISFCQNDGTWNDISQDCGNARLTALFDLY